MMDSAYRSKHLYSPSHYDVQPKESQAYSSPGYGEQKKSWHPFQRGSPKYPSADNLLSALQHEAEFLRNHTREQEKEIGHLKKRLQTRDQQQADLQAKWNFHSFKYQLLIDMWAMRVLDNESDGGEEEEY